RSLRFTRGPTRSSAWSWPASSSSKGQANLEQRASLGGLADGDVPAVRRDQVPGDGEAEARAAVVAAARVVQPHEPLEDPLAVAGRHARDPWVRLDRRLHRDAAGRGAVRDLVAQEPAQL